MPVIGTPIHYLLLRDFLGPWARRFGASTENWQQEIFDDLGRRTHDGISYVAHGDRGAIELVGRRFRCTAKLDTHRKDTLFVFEIQQLTNLPADPIIIAAQWRLNRGDGPLPPLGTPITGVAPLGGSTGDTGEEPRPPSPDLKQAIAAIVEPWTDAQMFGRLTSSALLPNPLLIRMRHKYARELRSVSSLITDDFMEGDILRSRAAPAGDSTIMRLHARFGISFLEAVLRQRETKMETVVNALLDLPPPVDVIRLLLEAWISGTARIDQLDERAEAVERWKARGNALEADWPTVVSSIRARLAAAKMAADAPGPNSAILDAGVDSAGSQATEVVSPTPPLERLAGDRVSTPAIPTLRRPLAPQAAQLRERLLALRAAPALAARNALFAAARALAKLGADLEIYVAALPEIEGAQLARDGFEGAVHEGQQALALLPGSDELGRIANEVADAVSRLLDNTELASAGAWLNRVTSWKDVTNILAIVADPSLEDLPLWFFRELAPDESDRAETILGAVADPDGQRLVKAALAWLAQELPRDDEDALGWLSDPRPGGGSTPLERLQSSFEAHRAEKGLLPRLESLCARLGPWARLSAPSMALHDLVNSLQAIADGLDELAARTPSLRVDCERHIQDATSLKDAHDRLGELETAYDAIPSELLAEAPSLGYLRKMASTFAAQPRSIEVVAQPMSLDHCVSEGGKVRAAQLVARPHPDLTALHVVDIPLNLRAANRCAATFEISIETPYLDGRPEKWRQLLGGHKVVVTDNDWVPLDGARLIAPAILRDIPVVRTRTDGTPLTRLTFIISGKGLGGGPAIDPVELTFEPPLYDYPVIDLPFGDTTSADEMHHHPLGIQKHFDEVARVVAAGQSSFLITAPRRFGKTTFLRALADDMRHHELVAIGPIAATEAGSIEEAFRIACEELGRTLGAHVPHQWSGPVPEADTFDAVRRRAAEQGKRAIYLLFDESQALFSGRSRKPSAAEVLKARIEMAWGASTPGMVPIRIGLVGQLHLRRLIAGQLDGVFFEDRSETEMDPDEIERFVRETTKGRMQSSRSARQLLASVSRNLLTLRFLLKEIRNLLAREQRTWFLRGDVRSVVEEQVEAAARGATTIGRYVLDPLNADDDLTIWRPIRSFPVAVAWAVVSVEGNRTGRPARLERTRALLERWASEHVPRASVSVQQIEQSLKELQDVNVLDEQETFRSPLLGGYLARIGASQIPLREVAEREVLQSLVVDAVVIPELGALEQVGQGAQAQVFYGPVEGRPSAVRVVSLEDDATRQEFIKTCYALRAIEGTRSRSAGYTALPVVRGAGFVSGDLARGAVIYDWIDGVDLAGRTGTLDEATVVRIGRPLAEAVAVLEQRGVVHRDVRPENIVVDRAGVPVLIDFGLAVLRERSANTRLGVTDFHAPETRTTRPEWSSKADVYALAVVLHKLLKHVNEHAALAGILREAREADPTRRLTPGDMVKKLGALAEQMSVDAKRNDEQSRIEWIIARVEPDWAGQVVRRHQGSALASKLGLFAPMDVLMLSSQFVDEFFEEWSRRNGFHEKHLTHLRDLEAGIAPAGLRPLLRKESFATGYLRHGSAHKLSQQDNRQRAQRELGAGGDLREAVLMTASRVEQAAGVSGAKAFVEHWLDGLPR